MSTNWTMIASDICRDALEHLGAVGTDQTVNADDQVTCLRALDAVLKALPLKGYNWPKLSTETALTWSAGTPAVITLPADFYNYAVVRKTVNGETYPLIQIPHASWSAMTNRTQTAVQPTHFYITPAKVLTFWPVPTVDPVATIQYQKIVDDASAAIAPDVLQIWLNPLGWGVADELSFKYGLNQADRIEINKRWAEKRGRALEGSVTFEDISISVDG